MKRHLISGAALVAAAALALSACGGGSGSSSSSSTGGEASGSGDGGKHPSVVNVINGPLGDQGFFDDAARGIAALEKAGSKTKNIEGDAENPAQWKQNLEAVSAEDWDIIICGTSQMIDILNETAPKFADKKYVIYDSVVEQPNVASIVYRQNEGSFLAGVLAAQATLNTDQFPKAQGTKKIGIVGGMDLPVINDFVVGFEKGAQSVDPSIQVLKSYVGDFTDSNKGYDLATAMYSQGADVVFQVAGGAGIGVLKAAEDADRYAIGVDSNQNGLHKGFILASMLKNIGVSLESAVNDYAAGKLEFGKTTEYGLANNGVSLTFEDNGDIVPQAIQDEIKTYAQKVVDGEIKVPTAY